MSTTSNAPMMETDFNHRMSVLGSEAMPHLMADTVNTMAANAIGILNLLSIHFADPDSLGTLSNDIIYNCLESAIKTVKDIDAVVESYYMAVDNPCCTDEEQEAMCREYLDAQDGNHES